MVFEPHWLYFLQNKDCQSGKCPDTHHLIYIWNVQINSSKAFIPCITHDSSVTDLSHEDLGRHIALYLSQCRLPLAADETHSDAGTSNGDGGACAFFKAQKTSMYIFRARRMRMCIYRAQGMMMSILEHRKWACAFLERMEQICKF